MTSVQCLLTHVALLLQHVFTEWSAPATLFRIFRGGGGGRGGDVDGHEVGNGKGVDREFDGEGLQQMNNGSEI